MNDRFKFRAWDGLEMHYNDFVVTATGYIGKITDEVGFICTINQSDLKADQDLELMQCTGLKDKNGKLIYEGDICKVVNGSINNIKIDHIRPIKWNGLKWNIPQWFYEDGFNSTHFIEVLGNLYENPELLESEEL